MTSNIKNLLTGVIISLLCPCLMFAGVLSASATASAPQNWYCVRAKNHSQPRADAALSFVEQYDGYYIDHRHTQAEAEDKVVYLTFDAGYENGNVAKVLDALKAAEVPGAFFILGNLPEAEPDLVRRMAAEGHLVCNHTFTHRDMTGSHASELEGELCRLEDACRDLCGVEISKFFRPPEGKFDRAMLTEAQRLGYKTVFWSFAYADWDNQKQPDPAAAKQKILDNIHNGAVILLHPTSATNAAILGDVIASLKAEGYRFGTLFELTEG
ncbi:MAG: polysaccharide deacetylase family protein [Clostridia bacterium]|nr:polysaccharide deacetylase family protein [Clostridia bacterium]